ncbi:hypothetical protein CCACVL1_12306 [Corchorus capsularis]|uniref:RRM domain-containing protein n=1 Tax=Corchorus capsularis TaxID=210143 RepID=A0A1R3IGI4_COCAP|nr:hypothetical protein CCACVL1_12306 [Corchorus capsularis]
MSKRPLSRIEEQEAKKDMDVMDDSDFVEIRSAHLGSTLPPTNDSHEMDPILGRKSSKCRRVYVGNIHPNVPMQKLQELFESSGAVEKCQIIQNDKSVSYAFVDYHDPRAAHLACVNHNQKKLNGQAIRVKMAYAETHEIYVGNLCSDVSDNTLLHCFKRYSCWKAEVMRDKEGLSKGFGYVSFRLKENAQVAINEIDGKWLGRNQIRCDWPRKAPLSND